ncbi:MAG TPA: 4-hydroxybenzoate 3-monooxygenase [Bryobacteraceae bacterium]|nr:4-hydroxybenzoate 3-monooxygenase [Bryobacteraceae bacterium]
MHTQVGIVGAGPAGLLLGHLLHLKGIDSVILESRSRDYTIERVRAGVLEQFTADLLTQTGVGARLQREGMRHDGLYLSFAGQRHYVPLAELTGGKGIYVYGQNEVVKDLIEARFATGRPLHYEVKDVSVHNIDSPRPSIRYEAKGKQEELTCDFIAGCDGFHGICRPALGNAVEFYDKTYPFGWLGILAEAAPSSESLVYTYHECGFALFSMRSPKITRLYFQVPPDEDIDQWPDEAIWDEMLKRMSTLDGWKPNVGPILSKGVTAMRSFVTEPMSAGRLYLAGDAAHIVPPTGAKGLNLAAFDVLYLGRAFAEFYGSGKMDLLARYSETALKRVWRAQRFSWWMTQTLHRFPDGNPFDHKRQLADLDYIASSKAALTSLAENYVGLPVDIKL